MIKKIIILCMIMNFVITKWSIFYEQFVCNNRLYIALNTRIIFAITLAISEEFVLTLNLIMIPGVSCIKIIGY